jgi:hypothetical protein
VDALLLEQVAQARPEQVVVVDDEDPQILERRRGDCARLDRSALPRRQKRKV